MSKLQEVLDRIGAAARVAGREPDAITLVAVSKFHPLAAVRDLAASGQADFGESREQDLRAKAAQEPALRWHFVGRLQTNKARSVARLAALVHSLDRASLVGPLARGGVERDSPLPVLLQVSLDGDPSRGGVNPAGLGRLADLVATEAGLHLAGLMAVAAPGRPAAPQFARLAAHAAALRSDHPDATILSAGMSADLEDAVEAGATHVRVGTALFGPRPAP